MPNGIPRKGEVLTQISHFWFAQTESFQPNHLVSRANDPLPANLQPFAAQLAGRSMIVKKTKPLAIECVVRGNGVQMNGTTRHVIVRILNNAMQGGLRRLELVDAAKAVPAPAAAQTTPVRAPVEDDAFVRRMPRPNEPCAFTATAWSISG